MDEAKMTECKVWFVKGNSFLLSDQLPQALVCFENALLLCSDFTEAWSFKGVALGWLQRTEEAIACQDRAIAIDDACGLAWFNKGAILADNLQRYEEALTCFSRAKLLGVKQADDGVRKCLTQMSKSDEHRDAISDATRTKAREVSTVDQGDQSERSLDPVLKRLFEISAANCALAQKLLQDGDLILKANKDVALWRARGMPEDQIEMKFRSLFESYETSAALFRAGDMPEEQIETFLRSRLIAVFEDRKKRTGGCLVVLALVALPLIAAVAGALVRV